MTRCFWVPENDPVYTAYHDNEWGRPHHDEAYLYELFLLECFQAGLSWACILHKRENFRRAFDGFDPVKIAAYGEEKIAALLRDAGIVRCRRKITAAIQNAQVFLSIQQEFGSFDAYIWGFSGGEVVRNRDDSFPTQTALSDAVSKDLKKRGCSYVGSVTIYSYLQAIGVVNDHALNCDWY